MVARDDWRRRAFMTRNFEDPGAPVPGPQGDYVCRPPAPIQGASPSPEGPGQPPTLPIALMSNAEDDVYVVPARLVVGQRVIPAVRSLFGSEITLHVPEEQDPHLPVVVAELQWNVPSDLNDTERTVEVFGRLRRADFFNPERLPEDAVAPLYAFISHQTSHTPDIPKNPQSALPLTVPAPGLVGQAGGANVLVMDTGVWNSAGRGPFAQLDDQIDLRFRPAGGRILQLFVRALNFFGVPIAGAATGGPFLGRAAGHGTFIRGLVLQTSPEATVTVRNTVSVEGLVDERRLVAELQSLLTRIATQQSVRPDVIVLALGGGVLKWVDNQRAVGQYVWRSPLLLALTIDRVLRELPGCIIVASAGNDGSSDPCYPAAFAADLGELDGAPVDNAQRARIVSVAALDIEGWKARFSNYGPWVRASTIGVRLVSDFVQGSAAPDSDPDQPPQQWLEADPIAVWTGTSFAAAVVAGVLAHRLAAARATAATNVDPTSTAATPVTAAQVWATSEVEYPISEAFGCGVAVPAGGVARLGPANTQLF